MRNVPIKIFCILCASGRFPFQTVGILYKFWLEKEREALPINVYGEKAAEASAH